MLVPQITTNVADALARLLTQYQGKPFIAGIITALVQQIQDLENGLYPIDQLRQLNFATGQQLDNIGEIIGITRHGTDDATYLILLLGEIAVNWSEGLQEQIIYIAKKIFEANAIYMKTPNSVQGPAVPANIALGIGSPQVPVNLYPLVIQMILNAISAGIRLDFSFTFNGNPHSAFSMAGPQKWVAGFGTVTDPTIGGGFASLIVN